MARHHPGPEDPCRREQHRRHQGRPDPPTNHDHPQGETGDGLESEAEGVHVTGVVLGIGSQGLPAVKGEVRRGVPRQEQEQVRDPDQEEGPDLEIGPERGLHGFGERRFLLRDIHQAEARRQEGDPSRATCGHQVEKSEVLGMGQSRNPPAQDELGQQVAHHRQDGCEGEGPFQAAGPALQAGPPLQALVHVDDGGGVRQPQDQPLTDDHPEAD